MQHKTPETHPRRGFSPTLLIFLVFPLLGIFAAAGLLINDAQQRQPQYVPSPPTPEPVELPTLVDVVDAPVIDFELPMLIDGAAGDSVRLTDYTGRVVFLNFWATWCEPCKRELPAFEQFTRDHADDPTSPVILAVNYGETPDLINTFLEQEGISGLNVLLDTDQRVGDSYGIFNLPVTFVIDERGIVRYPKYGEMTLADIQAYLDALQAG